MGRGRHGWPRSKGSRARRGIDPWRASPTGTGSLRRRVLDVESDGSHQFDGVAPGHDPFAQGVVEDHLPIFDAVLKVDIDDAKFLVIGDSGEGEVVSGDDSGGPPSEQAPQDGVGSDLSVVGVGAVENLIEQKENRRTAIGEVDDLA